MTSELARRLHQLHITLPKPSTPRFSYVPAVRSGDLRFFSGRTPRIDGTVAHPGCLGANLTVEAGRPSARIVALDVLGAIEEEVGPDHLTQVAKLTGFVASTAEFKEHPLVMDAASTLLSDVLGDVGRHARSAIGVASLSVGAAVELEVTISVPGNR